MNYIKRKTQVRMAKLKFSSTILTFSVLMMVFAPLSHASNLDALVAEALANNPDLAASKARWEQANYKAPQVGSLRDPVFSFAFSNYPSDSLSPSEAPMTGNEIKLAQMFPYPGKLDNRSALANEQARWFEAVYQDEHYKVSRKVKDAWYRLYFKQQAINVVERNLALVDDIIRLTEVRYETGTGLQQDVLKAQVQKSKLMEQMMSLQQQEESVQAELNNLVNRSEPSDFAPPQTLELPVVDLSLEEFTRSGLDNRPKVSAFKALIKRFKHQQRLAELDNYPDITLWGSWRFRDDDLPDEGTDFVSAGVSFNLPVYKEKRRAAQAEALAAIRMAERQMESFRSNLTASTRKAYARLQETYQQAGLYKSGIIPQTSQSFQAALSAYQVGKVAFVSLIDALMTTFKAEMDYYRLSSEYMRSLAWLEAESTVPLLGSPIVIDN
jgi:outer membrane protein TolC